MQGASGFKNSIQSATVNIALGSGASFSANLVPGQIFVSVDQTNGGAGFGSMYGPTYPMATYGGSADYANYNLATDFIAQGFAPFCPGGVSGPLCANGDPLQTTSEGNFVISFPFAPVYSAFSSTVSGVPEPRASAGWASLHIGARTAHSASPDLPFNISRLPQCRLLGLADSLARFQRWPLPLAHSQKD